MCAILQFNLLWKYFLKVFKFSLAWNEGTEMISAYLESLNIPQFAFKCTVHVEVTVLKVNDPF